MSFDTTNVSTLRANTNFARKTKQGSPMVDLKDLRENPDKYRRGAELKNVKADIDQILRLDEQHRSAQREFEKARAEQNEASKEIGKLKDASQKQAAIARVGELKTTVKTA